MSVASLTLEFVRSFAATDLVLYAGTNLHCVRGSDEGIDQIGMMPVIGPGREKQQPNVAALARIEQLASTQLCQVFHGAFAEARFHSCTLANLAVFIALLTPGDTVICLDASDGGHVSQNGEGMLAHLGVKLLPVPFDADRQCMDDGATAALVRESRPRLVVFGPSVVVRASDMTSTTAACRDVGAVLMMDVSHTAGLIAGGVLPNPLEQGADLITASSYKTLGCPPAGFIVGSDQTLQDRIERATSPKLLSNYDAGRLLRFTTALVESRGSLESYAQAIVANSAALRSALIDERVPLLTPTDGVFGTHQIVILAARKQDAADAVERLQQVGVTTSICGIPGRAGSWGIRLGTQLITRRGMGVDEMPRLARIVAAETLRGESRSHGQ